MRKIRRGHLAAAALSILAAACGGEGSNNGSGIVTGGAPAPTPTPTPTASQYPPAPFGISAAQPFVLLGWTDGESGKVLLDPARYIFGWGVSPDTYRITIPEVGSGTLRYPLTGINPYLLRIIKSDGSDTNIDATVFTGNFDGAPFYSTGQMHLTRQGELLFAAVFGIASEPAALPTSGTKVFRMTMEDKQWDLVIDFGSRQVTGKVAIRWEDSWGPYQPVLYDITDGIFDPATGSITGKFSNPETQIMGQLHARLMGPQANELALAVAGPVFDPYALVFVPTQYAVPVKQCATC